MTDDQGGFTLSVPVDAKTLIVSYRDFPKQEITIGDRTKFEITIK
jgi:hypothetical protein